MEVKKIHRFPMATAFRFHFFIILIHSQNPFPPAS